MRSLPKRWFLLFVPLIMLAGCGGEEEETEPLDMGDVPTFAAPRPTQPPEIPIAVDDTRFPIEADDAGKVLYEEHCAECHGINGEGQPPDVSGLIVAPPHNSFGHTWHHADQQNFAVVYLGRHVSGAQEMPRFGDKLTVDEIISVLAYLKTWWAEDERAMQRDSTLIFAGQQ